MAVLEWANKLQLKREADAVDEDLAEEVGIRDSEEVDPIGKRENILGLVVLLG